MSASMLTMEALVCVLLVVVVVLCYRLWKLRQVGGPRRSCGMFPPTAGTVGGTV